MKAQIITIGDELLIGQVVDTNSAWLAGKLNERGVRVDRILSVGDTREAIAGAVSRAVEENDLVLLTGGLGPTRDDITKRTLAELFGCKLVLHRPTFDFVREMLARRDIPFNRLNQDQALVPECCEVLPNPNGSAPGLWFDRGRCVVVSLPGVPFEMKGLMEEQVFRKIESRFSLKAIVHKTLLTYGIAESVLAARIADWEEALPSWLRLAYLPGPNGIRLRLSAYETDGADAAREVDRRFAQLEALIPGAAVGFEPVSLEGAVARMLTERGETLSVAESCTGGAVAARFTALPGASVYFLGSVTAYSNGVKEKALGVEPGLIASVGAVSEAVARQMAEGVRKLTGSDYALSTTGIAGPAGGSAEKPVGTVWTALAAPEGTFAVKKVFGGLREQNIARASSHAIDLLRLYLKRGRLFSHDGKS